MELSESDVRHVAKLAALHLTPDEVKRMQQQLSMILDYVAHLSTVPTEDIPPTCHVHGVVNAFRNDIVKESLDLSDLKRMAPDFSAGGFRVPRIINQD